MAITVLGGLTTATILNLGVLPEALIRLGRFMGIRSAGKLQEKTPEQVQAPELPQGANAGSSA